MRLWREATLDYSFDPCKMQSIQISFAGLLHMLLECLLFLPPGVKLWSCQNSLIFCLWTTQRYLPGTWFCHGQHNAMILYPEVAMPSDNCVLDHFLPPGPNDCDPSLSYASSFHLYPTYQFPPFFRYACWALLQINKYLTPTMCKPPHYL